MEITFKFQVTLEKRRRLHKKKDFDIISLSFSIFSFFSIPAKLEDPPLWGGWLLTSLWEDAPQAETE